MGPEILSLFCILIYYTISSKLFPSLHLEGLIWLGDETILILSNFHFMISVLDFRFYSKGVHFTIRRIQWNIKSKAEEIQPNSTLLKLPFVFVKGILRLIFFFYKMHFFFSVESLLRVSSLSLHQSQ